MIWNSELSPGVVGLGADLFGTMLTDGEAFRLLDAFCDAGGRWIDTANVYGRFCPGCENESEKAIGRWLKRNGKVKNPVIATKGGHYLPGHQNEMRLSRADVEADLDNSLKTLGVDCLDFYWLHRDDINRPIGEIVEYMEEFVRAGKIRFYGASNYTAQRLITADEYAKAHGLTGFSAVSNRYSLANVNKGFNLNPDPTLVIHGQAEEEYHNKTGKPSCPFQSTARGYFAKLASGQSIPDELKRSFDNPENRELFEKLKQSAQALNCSVQTAVIVETVRSAEYPILPLTSAKNLNQLADVIDAMIILNK